MALSSASETRPSAVAESKSRAVHAARGHQTLPSGLKAPATEPPGLQDVSPCSRPVPRIAFVGTAAETADHGRNSDRQHRRLMHSGAPIAFAIGVHTRTFVVAAGDDEAAIRLHATAQTES